MVQNASKAVEGDSQDSQRARDSAGNGARHQTGDGIPTTENERGGLQRHGDTALTANQRVGVDDNEGAHQATERHCREEEAMGEGAKSKEQ